MNIEYLSQTLISNQSILNVVHIIFVKTMALYYRLTYRCLIYKYPYRSYNLAYLKKYYQGYYNYNDASILYLDEAENLPQK